MSGSKVEDGSIALLLPAALPLVRLRLRLRLLDDATLPASKANLLRGGLGVGLQRLTCRPSCWEATDSCPTPSPCPYRWIFATPHPPDQPRLHDLKDVPRPFVIEPPGDWRTTYRAGEALEFGLVLVGRAVEHQAYFILAFEQLCQRGISRLRVPARLEQVEALDLEQPLVGSYPLWIQPLSLFHGREPWEVDHQALIADGRRIMVEHSHLHWVDWERTSTRDGRPQRISLGGLVGSACLRHVSPAVRRLLVAASIVHIGKACVFGHGGFRLTPMTPLPPMRSG